MNVYPLSLHLKHLNVYFPTFRIRHVKKWIHLMPAVVRSDAFHASC